jgi:CBS domain containing-hemolysin-like protein
MGKPEVVGGHHRLAVMQFDRPDDLIPVLHHRDIFEAKTSREYRYT